MALFKLSFERHHCVLCLTEALAACFYRISYAWDLQIPLFSYKVTVLISSGILSLSVGLNLFFNEKTSEGFRYNCCSFMLQQ